MQVIETNTKFSPLVSRPTTRRIVLHHSASGPGTTWQDIHHWHTDQGWAGIGYHYIIQADGSVYRGRPEGMKGAHAYQDDQHDANSDGIGICLAGNFETGYPTVGQLASVVWLIKDIWTRYHGIPVIGHCDVMPTACPGKNFPWAELKKRLEEPTMAEAWKEKLVDDALTVGLITERHNPDEPVTKWFVLAVCLNLLKAVKG